MRDRIGTRRADPVKREKDGPESEKNMSTTETRKVEKKKGKILNRRGSNQGRNTALPFRSLCDGHS